MKQEIIQHKIKFFLRTFHKIVNDLLFAKVVARQISKIASQQGIKDEAFILQKCNETTSPVGIYIKKLSAVAHRPTKKVTS